ncbi:MAG: hypothetical protein ACTHME_06255, partial [Candidatus Nitrosocosmicus sp.]
YVDYHNYTPEEMIQMMNDPRGMIVCPIPFGKWGDKMNWHLRHLFELGLLRISPKITPHTYESIVSAKFDDEKAKFNKKETLFNDDYDGCRLASINWKVGNSSLLLT